MLIGFRFRHPECASGGKVKKATSEQAFAKKLARAWLGAFFFGAVLSTLGSSMATAQAPYTPTPPPPKPAPSFALPTPGPAVAQETPSPSPSPSESPTPSPSPTVAGPSPTTSPRLPTTPAPSPTCPCPATPPVWAKPVAYVAWWLILVPIWIVLMILFYLLGRRSVSPEESAS